MFASYPSLAERVFVVTGGSSGIGAAIASELASHGARVVALDLTTSDNGGSSGIDLRHVDVTDHEALTLAINDVVEKFGRLDGLVANAANDTRHTIDELTPERWDDVMSVNLKHQFFAAKAAHPHLKTNGGSIVCLGSISWLNGTTAMPAYTTAKSAIHGLVRTLARLWGDDRIRVNAVLPGWTMTQRQLKLWVDESAKADIKANQCLPDFVMPEDIARMVTFLVADDSRMITNQAIVVDGGWI